MQIQYCYLILCCRYDEQLKTSDMKKIKQLYPNADKIMIHEAFKPNEGWRILPSVEPTLERIKTLQKEGKTHINLAIYQYGRVSYPDYSISELLEGY